MSYVADEEYEDSSKKKYIMLGAIIVVVAVAAVLVSGVLGSNETTGQEPDMVDGDAAVLPDLVKIVEEIDVPDLPELIPEREETGDTGTVTIEESIVEDAEEGDLQSMTDLALDLLIDTTEEFGLVEEDVPDESGLTMEDILGSDEPDPEDVSQQSADILERAEEFKKIPSEPVPAGAVSGTITWVVTGNVVNINEVMIHLTGVKAGGISDRDYLMGECPRDTLALYVLTGSKDSEGNSYGKVWCYGYPPTQPDTTINNILKSK